MYVVLTTLKWVYARVYTDKIILFLKTRKKHLQRIEKVLTLVNKAEMTRKMKKCSFVSETIDHLSHVIAPSKLHGASKNREVIKDLQYPTTVSEQWSLLRLRNAYQRFVPNFTELASSQNKERKEGEFLQFNFDEEEMRLGEVFKEKLVALLGLVLPQASRQ